MKKCPHCGEELTTKPKADPDGFADWWAISTRKVARPAAARAYAAALRKTKKETLLAAYRRYCDSKRGEDQTFTAHPATWLNQERWNEYSDSPPATRS